MMREDKKIKKALRAATLPQPPDGLLDTILSQNGLKRARPVLSGLRLAMAACAIAVAAYLVWPSGSISPSDSSQLTAKKQETPRISSIEKPVKKPDPKTVKVPRTLTGRETNIQFRKPAPKSYLASNLASNDVPVRPSISPVKVGVANKDSVGVIRGSVWRQNERGVWVETEVVLRDDRGQQTERITKTESDCKPQSLMVKNDSNDNQTVGGENE